MLLAFICEFAKMVLGKYDTITVIYTIVMGLTTGSNFAYSILAESGAIDYSLMEFLMGWNVVINILLIWPWAFNGLWASVKC